MDAKSWDRIESICLAALERPVDERSDFLDEACGDDRTLRREVGSLLDHFEADSSFLETPIVDTKGLQQADDGAVGDAPRYIGPYKLVRPLGRGGMGEVFLALHEGEDFRQSVAVKVIRRGMDTEDVLKRFRQERQILATLHHPNIGQLLDGGATEDGRPYFVMEHVEGSPIDEFCDSRRLSINQRLELFQVVCAAVQHAHQALVVHRDLKPSNILVTADGTPKLLDFGIGKVLDPTSSPDSTPATRTDLRVLTPEYASPEQVRGEPVTTGSDVYGLGVLLYELLSGHHPYSAGKGSAHDLERAVCDEDPQRPSTMVGRTATRRRRDGEEQAVIPAEVSANRGTHLTRLRRSLSGDLDTIVLKALRKEPVRRYSSASALADDIRRYRDGRTIAARSDTFRYRASKFVRRNRWAVAGTIAVFLALLVTTIVTRLQSQRVADERDKALEVRGFLLEMFGASGANRATGDSVTARQLLDRQAETVETAYGSQPELKAEMMEVLADGYDRLGLSQHAEPLAREALAIRRQTLGDRHPDVAASLNTLGWVLHQLGRTDEAEPMLRDAVDIRRGATQRRDRIRLARSLNDLGVVLNAVGNYDEAETLHREALAIRTVLHGDTHRSIGVSASNLSASLYFKGDYQGAVEFGERALGALRTSLGPDHQRSVIVQSNLAAFKSMLGDLDAAERDYRELAEQQARLRGPDDLSTAGALNNLARFLSSRGKYDEAEPLLRQVLAIREAQLGPTHPDLAVTLASVGNAAGARGDYDEAVAMFERALDVQRAYYREAHVDVGESIAMLAQMNERRGSWDEAERHHRDALREYETAVGRDHIRTATQLAEFAGLLVRRERPHEALPLLTDVHGTLTRTLPSGHWLIHHTRLRLAQARMDTGDLDSADSLLTASEPGLEAGEATNAERQLLQDLRNRLARLRGGSTVSKTN